MSNPNFIINDSEAESDYAIVDETPITQFHPAPAAPSPGPSYELGGYQSIPTSGEVRRKEIDEAHAALLSTGTLGSPTQVDPPSTKSKAKRRQTTHGRLESSIEKDVYSFNASDDEDFNPGAESKKRKRPASEKKAARKERDDEASDYGEGTKSGKKPAKRSKSAGLSVLDLLNDSSGDDWRPNATKPSASGKKSTRNNTDDAELLPPLPKPKRKPKESTKTTTYYDPTLDFSPIDTHSAEIQVAGTGPVPPTPQNFMVDLTKNDLILPSERRAEYDPVSPVNSTEELHLHLPSTNGVYNTPDLRSTIPDPPYDHSLLPTQIIVQQSDSHVADVVPLATASITSDSPLSSLQNSPVRETPATKKPRKLKKRAATDHLPGFIEDNGFSSFSIASEWRAAKGKARQGISQATSVVRSKTLNDLNAESEDDDVWVGDGKVAKKRKKPAAKNRKSTVNEDWAGGDGEIQKTKSKRKKGKQIETLVITDSEDELAGPGTGRSGTIQVAGTADIISPREAANNTISKLDANTPTPGDGLLETIAINSLQDNDQLLLEEQKEPKTKKLHKWQQLTKNTISSNNDEGSFPPSVPVVDDSRPSPIAVETEPEIQKATAKTKTQATAQRRKSKKDESEEEDWNGDPEPVKKKEIKSKTPRVTKKAAAAAAAKEAKERKEQEKAILSPEMIKGSEEEDLVPIAISVLDPKSTLDKKTPGKNEPKLSKAAAAKKAKAQKEKERLEAEAEETADEEDEKKAATPTPTLEAKPEPQTPSKKLMEKAKKTPHSPINKGPVKFRVGLSRRAHIEPLLKIIRK